MVTEALWVRLEDKNLEKKWKSKAFSAPACQWLKKNRPLRGSRSVWDQTPSVSSPLSRTKRARAQSLGARRCGAEAKGCRSLQPAAQDSGRSMFLQPSCRANRAPRTFHDKFMGTS